MFSQVWESMGFMRWPLAFSLGAVTALALWSAIRLFRPGASPRGSTSPGFGSLGSGHRHAG